MNDIPLNNYSTASPPDNNAKNAILPAGDWWVPSSPKDYYGGIQEQDPTGRTFGEMGTKVDAGKSPVWTLLIDYFPRALEAVAKVSQAGVDKGYAPHSWKTVPDGINRYKNAQFRHQLEMGKGKLRDTGKGGTNLPHSWQNAWNALAALELELIEDASK